MIDHVSLGTSDLARATAFYDSVLAPLGYVRLWTGAKGIEYGPAGGVGMFAIFQTDEYARAPGGGFHLALTAPNRQAVDAFHAEALRMGGMDEGAAGPRPQYGAGYYAAFIRDPDGYKLEAVLHES